MPDLELDDDDYLRGPAPHSGIGITSFVMALLTGIVTAVTLILAAVIDAKRGPFQARDPAAVTIGMTIIVSGILAFVGAVFGVVGLFQPNRRTLFPILGIVFNLLIVAGIGAVVALGVALGRR